MKVCDEDAFPVGRGIRRGVDLAVVYGSALDADGEQAAWTRGFQRRSRRFSTPGRSESSQASQRAQQHVATIARTRTRKKTPTRDTPDPNPEPAPTAPQATMKFGDSYKSVSSFLERCEKEKLTLPENPYDAMQEATVALKQSQGKQDEAMDYLKKRFAGGNKRPHEEDQNGGDADKENEEHENMPPHKRTRLLESARAFPALVEENQKLVDAFADYAQEQLDKGHTGKFVSHVRAANSIRDYEFPIKSGWDATNVEYIGHKMAGQIDEVLKNGKFKDETPDMNVVKDYDHEAPPLVHKIRDEPAQRSENQKIVDALADFGEYHLKYGNTGKGTSHLRAAMQIHESDIVVDSGFRAASQIGYIGEHIAEKIDQILKHGKIVHDEDSTAPHRISGEPAPIVVDLMHNPAKHHENQKIVDALRSYGDSHLRGGMRGKGISHLRAAVTIRDSDVVIKTAGDAKMIPMVGNRIAKKVDQILRHGHADSDDDYDEDEEEEEEEVDEEEIQHEKYGKAHSPGHTPPLLQDVRHHKAKRPENQPIVDALANYGEELLKEKNTGKGVTCLRAARQLQECGEVIKSGTQAKKVGMIGNTMAQFIEDTLKGQKKGK